MRIYIAGITGMVGSAIATEAKKQGHEVLGKPSKDLDLTQRSLVFQEMEDMRPDALIIAAAKVGGIGANASLPVDFLSINLQIQTNLLDAAFAADLDRVLFLGSSCIYPKYAPQPLNVSSLLTGALEPTNEAYALAKITGLKLIEGYRKQFGRKWISVMPTTLYGARDNFNLERAHVLPALMKRFAQAKIDRAIKVTIWGDGSPLREFLHVDDFAKACLMLLNVYDNDLPINVGSGQEITIKDLANLVAKIVEYEGEIDFDVAMPNGTPRKILDSSNVLALGWTPQISLENGISSTYDWFLESKAEELAK